MQYIMQVMIGRVVLNLKHVCKAVAYCVGSLCVGDCLERLVRLCS